MDDLLQCVVDDHHDLDDLLTELAASTPSNASGRERLLIELGILHAWHASAEEVLLYPILERDVRTGPMVRRLEDEHERLDRALEDFGATRMDAEHFDEELAKVSHDLHAHIDAEEADVFPEARRLATQEELAQLGRIWSARRDSLVQRKIKLVDRAHDDVRPVLE